MKKECNHKNPLLRDGLSQAQRINPALDPSYAKLDDRSTKDLLEYAYRYAEHIRYFNANNENIDDQNWQVFWETINDKTVAEIESTAGNEPHLALFLCFLKLFSFAQDQMNTLTGEHLDFYYKKVLQLKQKPEQADHVHLIFELAKNAQQQMILAGTPFKAGEDNTGVARQYIAVEDTIVSKAQVELLRSVYRKENKLFFASVSNSKDGLGEEPIDEGQSWKAFGGEHLPMASLGFAVSSPILALQEGVREVTLNLSISSIETISFNRRELIDSLEVYVSGEKEWLGPYRLTDQSACTLIGQTSNSYLLKIHFKIPKDHDPVVPYDVATLSGGFNTTAPVARVVLNNGANTQVFTQLEKTTLIQLQISVDVKEMTTLTLENDQGFLNASKPFLPFGPQPVKGSNFYIGSKEAFTKQLKSFELKPRWHNLPENGFSPMSYKAKLDILSGKNWGHSEDDIQLFDASISKPSYSIFIDFNNKKSGNSTALDKVRLSQISKLSRPVYIQSHLRFAKKGTLVAKFEDRIQFKKNLVQKRRKSIIKKQTASNLNLDSQQKDGFIKLSLKKDFGHKAYPGLLAAALASLANNITTDNRALPSEPYTPMIESLSLDYVAETDVVNMDSNSANKHDFENREIQYFHLAPFGHSEEHSYLKSELPFQHSTIVKTLPQYFSEGTFYIGLKELKPKQSINILLQLDEGTANPESPTQEVEWSILSNNHWKILDANDILSDQTNQLLSTGILKMIIPKQATDDNTLMDEGYYWLKASVAEHTDAVCEFVGVHTQAIKAVFNNQNNDPHHLETALEAATIAKLQNRLSSVKKIKQPYASFGGYPIEKPDVFYTRISERLRHKNRAVSIWDYEHLLLEKFPNLYKVKCLNHTSPASEMAPGHVSIITIPQLRNKNTPDQLKPRVSSNTLSEIQTYLSDLASMFTTITAQNPDYEEVLLEFEVAFHDNLEYGFYKKQLNLDITKFLSPWAFEEGKDIRFGGRIHKSVLINFIDGLPYVDFVSNFYMYHKTYQVDKVNGTKSKKKEIISASNSRAILVSAPKHTINPVNEALICK